MPKVQSGLAAFSLLIGYRNNQFLLGDLDTPPVNFSTLSDIMEKYLELLENENSTAASAILGHFVLVSIHPFSDGNGRTSRFIMNAALVLTGYIWTFIRNENKNEYFEALEEASVCGEIEAFNQSAQFFGRT
jgi:Fic family protein